MKQVILLSPHFDDALFSAGGLLWQLKQNQIKTTVVNIFTQASNCKPTLSAKKFLQQVQATDAEALYIQREKEDHVALEDCATAVINLGFTEALWRTRKPKTSIIANLFPEMNHIYPTYRWHIISGKISPADTPLIEAITEKIRNILKNQQDYLVLCPLGIGNHVDHLVVKKAAENLAVPLIYWEDIPYVCIQPFNKIQNGLKKIAFHSDEMMKKKSLSAQKYISQYNAVLRNINLVDVPETYHGENQRLQELLG